MKTFDADLVGDEVTALDIELAHDAEPAPFQNVDLQDDTDDVPVALTRTTVRPATPREAGANAKRLRDDHVFCGVGLCLKTVRGPIFGLPALWPTAADAYDHGKPYFTFDDLTKVPYGMWISWATPGSDDPGHTALSIGGGLCSTTDYHETGFEGIALISKLASWCGDPFRGGGDTLNGFDVWPGDDKTPTPPHPKPLQPLSLEEKIRIVKRRIRDNVDHGHTHRAKRLELWLEQLKARQTG